MRKSGVAQQTQTDQLPHGHCVNNPHPEDGCKLSMSSGRKKSSHLEQAKPSAAEIAQMVLGHPGMHASTSTFHHLDDLLSFYEDYLERIYPLPSAWGVAVMAARAATLETTWKVACRGAPLWCECRPKR